MGLKLWGSKAPINFSSTTKGKSVKILIFTFVLFSMNAFSKEKISRFECYQPGSAKPEIIVKVNKKNEDVALFINVRTGEKYESEVEMQSDTYGGRDNFILKKGKDEFMFQYNWGGDKAIAYITKDGIIVGKIENCKIFKE